MNVCEAWFFHPDDPKRGPVVPLTRKRRVGHYKELNFMRLGLSPVQLRRATLYPAELRVLVEVHLADWRGASNRFSPDGLSRLAPEAGRNLCGLAAEGGEFGQHALGADDAVAAKAFGRVERLVGRAQQPVGAAAIGRTRNVAGDADAEGDVLASPFSAMGDRQGHDGDADILGDGAGGVAIHVRQDQRKFLAAIAAGEIERTPGMPADDGGDRPQAFVAALMAVPVVEQLEMIDVDEQQRHRLLRPLGAVPFAHQHLVEGAPVRQAGQPVLGGELLQRHLGALLIGEVAQRFHHRDQMACLVVDRAGVDGEIELAAELRHHAPVLRGKAEPVVAARGIFRIELRKLLGLVECDEIGKAGALGLVKGLPVFRGSDHLGGGDAGQPLAGPVPDHDATLGVDHEGRHHQMLHQPHGIGIRDVDCFRWSFPRICHLRPPPPPARHRSDRIAFAPPRPASAC